MTIHDLLDLGRAVGGDRGSVLPETAEGAADLPAEQDADAIVIGSGFGGAVAAARLAQAGWSVIVLERGRRWRPGDFPRRPQLDDGWLWHVDQGLYDVRWLEGMLAVQVAGFGGGSLAYANVFARPLSRRAGPPLARPPAPRAMRWRCAMTSVSGTAGTRSGSSPAPRP